MAQVLARTSTADYVAANVNRASRGDNGRDHVVVVTYTRVSTNGEMPTSALGEIPDPVDPVIAEGYSSSAGLGLALALSAGVGLLGVVGAVARALLG